jgi:deoxyribodipyrimidine photolyase-related protein
MSQHGDGGVVGTKPYVSTGNYIHRMSPFCGDCRYNPRQAIGDDACPFTTLYWDFLDRHYRLLKKNHRMGMQIKNLETKRNKGEIDEIRSVADALKRRLRD